MSDYQYVGGKRVGPWRRAPYPFAHGAWRVCASRWVHDGDDWEHEYRDADPKTYPTEAAAWEAIHGGAARP
jgi:hypothetical protein